MRKRILFDVDGIIVDYVGWYVSISEMVLERKCSIVDPSNWDMSKQLGLSEDEKEAVKLALHTHPTHEMQPYPGAIDFVSGILRKKRLSVYFVTTSMVEHRTWEYHRRRWFDRYFGSDASRRLVFAQHKHIVDGDVLVEDNLSTINKWASTNLGLPVLWNRPWNFGETSGRVTRVSSWEELEGEI